MTALAGRYDVGGLFGEQVAKDALRHRSGRPTQPARP